MTYNPRPRVLVDMSATLLHHGHTRLLAAAAKIGYVIVGLVTDEEIESTKGYTPELTFEERQEILLAIRHVDEVIPAPWHIDDAFLDEHHIDLLFHGSDNKNAVSPHRLKVVPRTEGVSSSALRARVLRAVSQLMMQEES